MNVKLIHLFILEICWNINFSECEALPSYATATAGYRTPAQSKPHRVLEMVAILRGMDLVQGTIESSSLGHFPMKIKELKVYPRDVSQLSGVILIKLHIQPASPSTDPRITSWVTKQSGTMVTLLTCIVETPGSNLGLGIQLSWLRFFVALVNPSRKMSWKALYLDKRLFGLWCR
jgi:hypothetical protein